MARPTRPVRTCVGCRGTGDPATMVRFVLDGDRVVLDPDSRAPGRGAHLHPDPECWRGAVRGGFARSFRRRITVQMPRVDWLPDPANWA